MKLPKSRHLGALTTAALLATFSAAPAWAQDREEPAAPDDLYEERAEDQDEPEEESADDGSLEDLDELPLVDTIALTGEAQQFRFVAQRPGMLTLFIAPGQGLPIVVVENTNGTPVVGGALNAQAVRQENFNPNNLNAQQIQLQQGFGGNDWNTNVRTMDDGTSIAMLVAIPAEGVYRVTIAATGPDGQLRQPNRRWATPVIEEPVEGEGAEEAGAEAEDAQAVEEAPETFAAVQWLPLLSQADQLAAQQRMQERIEEENRQRIANATPVVSGQAMQAQGAETWLTFTAEEEGFLVLSGRSNADLRFGIHAPEDIDYYLAYFDDDRGGLGNEAAIYPLNADQTILIRVMQTGSRSANATVNIRPIFTPNALPAQE